MTSSANRDAAVKRALDYFDDGQFERELARRVAIHTESQKSGSLPELHRYLDDEMIPAFKNMGFDCRKFNNPVPGLGPFLLATRHEDDDLPTLLGYGHGDVIRGLDDQWTKGKGPWVAMREGDRFYGRGTADNKGQHTLNMAAMRCVLEERRRLGFNAKYLIEMGEEMGSIGLAELVAQNGDDFKSDVFIGSDGPRIEPDRPTLTLGARGAKNFNLVCELREGGHHSGNWGGLLADPAIILVHAIASFVGSKGEIRIGEWLPPEMPQSVKDALANIEIDPGPGAPAIDPHWGQPGLSPAEKVYASNSFAILAMTSGNPDRPVNAISPNARAHCQLRYFAGTRADEILPALRRHLDAQGFTQVKIEPPPSVNAGGFSASRTEPDDPWVMFVRQSVGNTIGEAPVVLPSMGGSICNEVFTDILGIPAIWVPHSYAACSQHAPDEHILLPVSRSALKIMAGLYWDLGEGDTPQRKAT